MSVTIPVVAADGAKSTVTLPAPVVSTTSPSPGLFFKLPVVSSSPKRVLAHYFGPYVISIDTAGTSGPTDYYATQYIPPTGEGNKHLAYGGYVRNRPAVRPLPAGNWQLADAATEIANARGAGIDGFFCNHMGQGPYLSRYTNLIAAAANTPGFLVAAMLDCSPGGWQNAAISSAVTTLAEYYGKPSTWMDGGAMVVGSFLAENNSAAWWGSLVSACRTAGFTVKFAHVYLNQTLWNQNSSSSQWAAGQWGPIADANIANQPVYPPPASVRAAGQKVLAPVVIQNQRPNWHDFGEALNTRALTNFWNQAIAANADVVQMTTWCDYSEGSQFANTAATGLVPNDISAYYIALWKTGVAPTILRDVIYLSYRNHLQGAHVGGPQTIFMAQDTFNGMQAPITFNVEALVFLTAPATVTVTVAGVPHTFAAAAGMSRFTVPAALGAVSATAVRSGVTTASVAPPVLIRSSLWADDWTYFMFSSIRGTSGQFDPQMTSAGAIPVYP